MAAPIGPWIAPTLVLIASLLLMAMRYNVSNRVRLLTLTTVAGSVGGIIATAAGFSFPTLYFIDPDFFNQLLGSPWNFVLIMGGLALAAGSFGFMIADMLDDKLLNEQKLPFPIGQLVYKMISAGDQVKKAWQLAVGFFSSLAFSIVQSAYTWLVPYNLHLCGTYCFDVSGVNLLWPSIRFDIAPIWWAIGFVTGHVIALPLFIGALIRIFVIDHIHANFFANLSSIGFILAFCTGMIVVNTIPGLISSMRYLWKFLRTEKRMTSFDIRHTLGQHWWQSAVMFLVVILFLSWMGCSVLMQAYLLLFTFVCVYQMVVIAGKTGLALLGRFATFVMVPALFLFNVSTLQIVIIATFVEMAGGVATDILFGRKIGQLAQVDREHIRRYQFMGLVVSALLLGLFFLLLIKQFGLGSEQLFAQKAQARALLINVREFDFVSLGWVSLIGAIVGYLLSKVKVNPMMALGGILMPLNITLALVTGGAFALFPKDKEEYYPFWSGVYAAGSLWMLVRAMG